MLEKRGELYKDELLRLQREAIAPTIREADLKRYYENNKGQFANPLPRVFTPEQLSDEVLKRIKDDRSKGLIEEYYPLNLFLNLRILKDQKQSDRVWAILEPLGFSKQRSFESSKAKIREAILSERSLSSTQALVREMLKRDGIEIREYKETEKGL
jgi:hypothetical protein